MTDPSDLPYAPALSADPPVRTHRHGWWWKTLLTGLGLWLITIVVTVVTLNANLIPTLILVGSFLVPLCVVLFAAERLQGNMSVTAVILLFFLSGLFGVLGASLLEAYLTGSVWTLLLIGIIEETLKLVILVVAGRRYVPKTAHQGALLGAVVGAGFAAFESAGYAFNAALSAGNGVDLVALVQTEVLRAALSPVGHVLWTSILGAVLFAAARAHERYRVTPALVGALIGVSLLHAAWDGAAVIAEYVALVLTGTLATAERTGEIPSEAAGAVAATTLTLYIVGLIVVSGIGLLTLTLILRRHRRADAAVAVA